MNDLEKYFKENDKRVMHKWCHYFDIYDRHFAQFRNKPVIVVEIGVWNGGSLQMWKNYFGAQAKIYGIDIDPRCKILEEEQITVLIGSQEDKEFLRSLVTKIGSIDIVIDDGGHMMNQQITAFQELYPFVSENGIYLCEDTHTSYWQMFNGGCRRHGTFIEYSKGLIDQLHAWHTQQPEFFNVTEFTKTTNSLHYYDSVLVIEKQRRTPPTCGISGKIQII
jgi:hypothetical protein